MRFKYKKMIIVLSLGVLYIAFISFSMMEPSNLSFTGNGKKQESGAKGEKKDSGKKDDAQSTKSQNDTPVNPGNEINSKIEELVVSYMKAKQEVDMEAMGKYVTDTRNIDEKKLLTWAEYVEDTRNIDCTILAGADEDSYYVIAYYEYKFFDVETLAPGLTSFYVVTDSDGELRIYMGVLDKETQDYLNELYKGDTVKKLKNTVEEKYDQAVQSDEKLREVREELEQSKDTE